MQEDILYQPLTIARGAVAAVRSLASVYSPVFLAVAILLFGWDQAVGFTPVADILAKSTIVFCILASCWKRGGAVTWLTLFFGVLFFVQVRSTVHLLGIQPHTGDLREIEQTLFFGMLPSQFLQGLFFYPGSVGPIDYLATLVDLSYFLVPYAVVFSIWLVQPRAAHRLVHPLILTFLVSVVIYGVLPATPPWLASAEPGAPQIFRIMHQVGTQFDATVYDRVYQSIGDPNPTAALPSVHFAITFLLFLYSIGRRRVWMVLGGAYAAIMLVSLVYLGEHYVIDTILGGAVAANVWYSYHWVASRLFCVDRAVGREIYS